MTKPRTYPFGFVSVAPSKIINDTKGDEITVGVAEALLGGTRQVAIIDHFGLLRGCDQFQVAPFVNNATDLIGHFLLKRNDQ